MRNSTDAMRESRVLDILNAVRLFLYTAADCLVAVGFDLFPFSSLLAYAKAFILLLKEMLLLF